MVRPRYGMAAAGLLVLSLLTAGCGGAGSPSAVATPNPTTDALPSVAATGVAATTVPTVAPTTAASPAPALKLLWEKAGDTTPMGADPATYWPAIDPLTGNVWVALGANGVYWIFSPEGKYLGSFGEPGGGPGQFNFKRDTCPECYAGAIAFAPDGSFFVADDGNTRIQKFDAAHHLVKAWGTFGSGDGQFADPNSIATDGKQVYVYDDVRTDIQVFDMNGKLLRTVANESGWMTVDGAGHLWAADAQGISEFDASGKLVKAYPLPASIRISLAIDAAGRLYYNLQDQNPPYAAQALVRFDPATSALTLFSTAGETLAIAPKQDAIYEANFVSPGWPSPVLRKYALPAK